ncbi:MAG: hypothetical protein HRT88_20525 [Lentisphaeraceae bacterium]|nr:hypothetical protein [Lentisphaeraceae bacterium]
MNIFTKETYLITLVTAFIFTMFGFSLGKKIGVNVEYQRWSDGPHSDYLDKAEKELNEVIATLEKAGTNSEMILKLKELLGKFKTSNEIMLNKKRK